MREHRNQPLRANTQIYVPTKYRSKFFGIGKGVASYGTVRGKSKRVQIHGSGKSLYQAMRLVAKHPPRDKFLTISADELLRHPKKYLDRGEWDARPKINS